MVSTKSRMWVKCSALTHMRKYPEIFMCSLAMCWVCSAKLLVKGTVGSAMNSNQASQAPSNCMRAAQPFLLQLFF